VVLAIIKKIKINSIKLDAQNAYDLICAWLYSTTTSPQQQIVQVEVGLNGPQDPRVSSGKAKMEDT